jgi:hypothetical protein
VNQVVKWPNVTLGALAKFESSIDSWFKRKATPIWLTEYGYQTKPPESRGVSLAAQSANIRTALLYAARDPRVQMFIWFTYRDDAGNPWKSGLVASDGNLKPSYQAFASAARPLDGRDLSLVIKAGRSPVVAFPARELARDTAPGEGVGVTYSVYDRTKAMGVHQPLVPMGRDGWVNLPLDLNPVKGHTYTVIASANAHGTYIRRQLTLKAV